MDPVPGADTQPTAHLPSVAPEIPNPQSDTLPKPPVPQAPVVYMPPLTETPAAEAMGAGDSGNKKKVFVIGAVVLVLIALILVAIYFAPRISSKLP